MGLARNWCWSGVLIAASIGSGAAGQIPERFENLQFLPHDISRDSLLDVMRNFSFALGVRCQYCHIGGDGVSFDGVEFHPDDDPRKRKARFMLRMVRDLNARLAAELPGRSADPVRVTCKTCHRGLAKPLLLTQDLERTLESAGVDAAVARYRELREDFAMAGAYDFGEWEMNTLAERLTDSGRPRDAIAIYELNVEFFPASVSIHLSLGQLYETIADTTSAVRSYERVLELRPTQQGARGRLAALRGGR